MTDENKILVVVGASGVQGSSVVRAVLTDPALFSQFRIRAVSRDPATASSKLQYPEFVQWIKADLNDKASLEKAFEGAHTVFGVTDFWSVFSAEGEAKQGRTLADAAKKAGVKHLIWSAQLSAKKVSDGNYESASHLDGKYEVAEYLEEIKGDMVSTHVCVPFYMSNIPRLFAYTNPADGVVGWSLPWDGETTKIGYIDAAIDTGLWVANVMRSYENDPASINGKYIHAVTQFLSPNDFCAAYKNVFGEEMRYNEMSLEQFKSMLPPALSDLPTQMAMVREFGLYGKDEKEVQPKHDRLLGGAQKSSLEEYLRRDWERDLGNPMIPPN